MDETVLTRDAYSIKEAILHGNQAKLAALLPSIVSRVELDFSDKTANSRLRQQKMGARIHEVAAHTIRKRAAKEGLSDAQIRMQLYISSSVAFPDSLPDATPPPVKVTMRFDTANIDTADSDLLRNVGQHLHGAIREADALTTESDSLADVKVSDLGNGVKVYDLGDVVKVYDRE